jgi:hypothetical protein
MTNTHVVVAWFHFCICRSGNIQRLAATVESSVVSNLSYWDLFVLCLLVLGIFISTILQATYAGSIHYLLNW